jgi:hypothetical protein
MTTKKKILFSNDDESLMMTDDLLERIDPKNLIDVPKTKSEDHFYADDHDDTPIVTMATLKFTPNNMDFDTLTVTGSLQVLSFGEEGWRVAIDDVNPEFGLLLAKQTGKSFIAFVDVVDVVRLKGKIDTTVHFGGINGKCSISVGADQSVNI